MNSAKFFKLFSIVNFLIFVIGFIAYKVGVLDEYFNLRGKQEIHGSHNGGPINRTYQDTPKLGQDSNSIKKEISFLKTDSLISVAKKDSSKIDSLLSNALYISSSKSMSVSSESLHFYNLDLEQASFEFKKNLKSDTVTWPKKDTIVSNYLDSGVDTPINTIEKEAIEIEAIGIKKTSYIWKYIIAFLCILFIAFFYKFILLKKRRLMNKKTK